MSCQRWKGDPSKPFDGKDATATIAEGKPLPHDDILINVEVFRGAIRKGKWKLIKVAILPGKTELFDLEKDPGEKENVADQHPEVVKDLEARLLAYAKQQKTVLDPGYNIDRGLPTEKLVLPMK